MKKYAIPVKTPDDYISQQPVEYREMLETLRSIIQSVASKAEETISYQVIVYKYLYMLVGIGTSKGYCSFYTMNPVLVKKMKADLKGIKHSGSTIHFPPGERLPVQLIKKIVTARLKENKERAEQKKKK